MPQLKLGLYGGTFSPPHIGHKRIAEAFTAQCGLDLLLIMPANIPPHKRISADDDPQKRLDMASLAFADVKGAVVSRLELDRVGPSYTVDTLTMLYELYGMTPDEGKIKLLCGADMFLSLDTWYRAEEIFRIADIVYAPRGIDGDDEKLGERAKFYAERYGAVASPLNIEPFMISSSDIRAMIGNGDDVSDYIDPSVRDYIEKAGLYAKR